MATGSSHVSAGGGKPNEDQDTLGSSAGSGVQNIQVTGTDDLLDEIDGLLENNAEEFVRSYVQKGGE